MKRLNVWFIAIALNLMFFSYKLETKILMQPYLQAMTDSSVIVLVECDNKSPVTVEFKEVNDDELFSNKTKFSISTNNRKKTYVHRILLNKLKANTRYSYRAIHNNDTSHWKQFSTFPNGSAIFNFAVMGDNRSNPEIFGNITRKMKSHHPLFSLYLGDLAYDSKYGTWKEEFFVKNNLDFISEVPFFNAVGNHEGWEENTIAFQQAPDMSSPDKNLPYYAFECEDVFFLILSSLHPLKEGTEQYKFAEKVIANIDKKWKIAAVHHPPYSCGGHKGNEQTREITTKLLEPNNFDIVLAGHSHFYQHNLVNGIRHIISGGGGSPLYNPVDCDYTIKSVKDYHYLIFEVTHNIMIIEAIDLYDNVIDRLELIK